MEQSSLLMPLFCAAETAYVLRAAGIPALLEAYDNPYLFLGRIAPQLREFLRAFPEDGHAIVPDPNRESVHSPRPLFCHVKQAGNLWAIIWHGPHADSQLAYEMSQQDAEESAFRINGIVAMVLQSLSDIPAGDFDSAGAALNVDKIRAAVALEILK